MEQAKRAARSVVFAKQAGLGDVPLRQSTLTLLMNDVSAALAHPPGFGEDNEEEQVDWWKVRLRGLDFETAGKFVAAVREYDDARRRAKVINGLQFNFHDDYLRYEKKTERCYLGRKQTSRTERSLSL